MCNDLRFSVRWFRPNLVASLPSMRKALFKVLEVSPFCTCQVCQDEGVVVTALKIDKRARLAWADVDGFKQICESDSSYY
jgi:hypothetical protein